MENAWVQVTDASGATACSNASGAPAVVVADSAGAYRCELSSTARAPLALLATDPSGTKSAMVSALGALPVVGQAATANITPLSTAVVAMLSPGNDIFAIVPQPGDSTSLQTQRLVNLATVSTGMAAQIAALVAQISPLLVELGLAPASFSPITSTLVPRTTSGVIGNSVDKLLDILKVDFTAGIPKISTLFGTAVSVAAAGAAGAATVSANGAAAAFTPQDLDFARTALQACFTQTAAARVPNGTTTVTVGGATRTAVALPLAPACTGIVVDDAPAAARGTDSFLNGGVSAAVYFRRLLTDPKMDGAKFNVVDILHVIPAQDGKDQAIVNIKWTNNQGDPGNYILMARKYPGSRASGTQWWLVGNQQPVNAFVRPWSSRTLQTVEGYIGSNRSSFLSGLLLYVERGDNNNPNTDGLTAAKITGPGLPTAGMVLVNPYSNSTLNDMGMLNKTGTIPTIMTTSTAGDLYRLQGTDGITRYLIDGTGITDLGVISSPSAFSNAGSDCQANTTDWDCIVFVHPSDFGLAPSTNYVFDVGTIPPWSEYTIALYYDNATTPRTTFKSLLTTGLATTSALSTQQWGELDAATLAQLNPNMNAAALPQTSFTIGWNRSFLSDRVSSVAAYGYSGSGWNVNANSWDIPMGIYSTTVTAPTGFTFPPLVSGERKFQLRFLRTDGVYKDSFTQYN